MILSIALLQAILVAQVIPAPAPPRMQSPAVFDVAVIRPSKSDEGWKLQPTLDGYTARNVTLRSLIEEAYGIYDDDRILGGPSWVGARHFDIEAKIDTNEMPGYRNFTLDQRRSMLQNLLATRFRLVVHHEPTSYPVYALVLTKDGPKLIQTNEVGNPQFAIKGVSCQIHKSFNGLLDAYDCSISDLAGLLHNTVHRVVIDESGIKGRYDIQLHWSPEGENSSASGPSIWTALKDQLGLQLKPAHAILDSIAVDHVELPSDN